MSKRKMVMDRNILSIDSKIREVLFYTVSSTCWVQIESKIPRELNSIFFGERMMIRSQTKFLLERE